MRRREDNTSLTLSISVTSTSIATIVSNVAAGFAAASYLVREGITATTSGGVSVLFTSTEAGRPHSLTLSTRDAGGAADAQTLTYGTTTANSGPYDFQTALNWSTAAVPVNGDNIYLDGRMQNAISYGLVNTITPANVFITAPRSRIGTPTIPLRLGIPTGKVTVTDKNADGSSGSMTDCVNLNMAAATIDMQGSNSTGASGLASVMFGGGTFTLNQIGGNLGIGLSTANEASTLAATTSFTGGTLALGTGTVWTGKTINQSGGTLFINSGGATTTLTQSGGSSTMEGSGLLTVLNLSNGTHRCNQRVSGNEIDTINLSGGDLNFSGDPGAVALGTLTWSGGSITKASPDQTVTVTSTTASFPTGKKKLTLNNS